MRQVDVTPFAAVRAQMLAELRTLVQMESPSRDKEALDRIGGHLARRLRGLGAEVEIVANADGGDHVVGRFAGEKDARPALALGHFDTVWPVGTLERMPFRIDDSGGRTALASTI